MFSFWIPASFYNETCADSLYAAKVVFACIFEGSSHCFHGRKMCCASNIKMTGLVRAPAALQCELGTVRRHFLVKFLTESLKNMENYLRGKHICSFTLLSDYFWRCFDGSASVLHSDAVTLHFNILLEISAIYFHLLFHLQQISVSG